MLGLGALGSAVAVALASIGYNVTGWSRTEKNIANKTPANEKLAGDEVAPIKKEEVQSEEECEACAI